MKVLLNGITGSGKTKCIFRKAMQTVLAQGKQVLILVPEIGLTPQTRRRFAERFEAQVLMRYSGLNTPVGLMAGNNADWAMRKLLSVPVRQCYTICQFRLIIVDESHDQSYKQQDSLRYHASDVALYQGFSLSGDLGTATPSLLPVFGTTGKLTELF